MGWQVHHTIVVTSWDDESIEKAHKQAMEIFPRVSEITEEQINGYRSFFIPPDGSKEGWQESQEGNNRRATFIEWLNDQRDPDDLSTRLDWIELQFGSECEGSKPVKIINDSSNKPIVRRENDAHRIFSEETTGDCFDCGKPFDHCECEQDVRQVNEQEG